MHKKIPASLKIKVAIEAIKGFKTISEIAIEYSIHPNQVSQWKMQFLDNTDQQNWIYYNPKDKIDNRIKVILDLIDEIYTKYPFYGAR